MTQIPQIVTKTETTRAVGNLWASIVMGQHPIR